MYIFKIGIPTEVHDTFVKNHPLYNLLQLSSRAEVKDNWGSEIVGVYEKDTLVASSLALIRPLPASSTTLYTSGGPVMGCTNEHLVNYFMAELEKFGKKKRALSIKMNPAVHYQDFHLGEEHQPHTEATPTTKTLRKAGAKYQGLTMDMRATIQPRFQANIYREDFSEEQLSKSTRKMIKIAEKKEVIVQQGYVDSVDGFEKVIRSTMGRQHTSLRNSDYFEKLLDIYPEDSFIMLAQVNLKKHLDDTQQRYGKNQKDLNNLEENRVKKRHSLEELNASLTRELKELEENIAGASEIVTAAGALAVTFGPTSEILYAGLDDHCKRYIPAYVTWRDAIEECFDHGCESCNIGSLESSLDDNLIKFEASFNPAINEFVEEFDLSVSELLFEANEYAYKLRKQKK